MTVTLDPAFARRFGRLLPLQQQQVAEALNRLRNDASHPSLNFERHIASNLYTIRLNRKYRLLLRRVGGDLTVLRVVHHDTIESRGAKKGVRRW